MTFRPEFNTWDSMVTIFNSAFTTSLVGALAGAYAGAYAARGDMDQLGSGESNYAWAAVD